MFVSFPGDTGSEDMKRSLRAAEAWHHESTGEAVGEGIALVVIEASGLKQS